MNTTLTTPHLGQSRTSLARPSQRRVPRPETTSTPTGTEPADLLGKRPASEITRLVFCAILGMSAIVALVGVLNQASTTSPDAPPPAVIVDFD